MTARDSVVSAPAPTRRRPRLRTLFGAAALVAVGAVVAFALRGGNEVEQRAAIPTSTATVARRSLVVRESVDGTLGYGARKPLAAPRGGVVTWLPPEGALVRRGGRLLGLDGATAAVLLLGALPMWRTLEEGIADGEDVLQLERNLVALGLARGPDLTPDTHFDVATRAAVERLQERLGLETTGSLGAGLLRFSPSARRIAARTAGPGSASSPAHPCSSSRAP